MHDSSLSSPIPSWKWGVVWLLFLATMINYMDRQTMQVTSSQWTKEFFEAGTEERGYGRVESAFQYAFATSMLLAGFLVDRMNVRWLYLAALAVWSLAGLGTGLVTTLQTLIACRVVLGIAEAFNWPCAVSIVRRLLPLDARAMANGIFHSGASIGAAITPLLAQAMIVPGSGNWRNVFIVVGASGGFWMVAWLWFLRGDRARIIERETEPETESKDSSASRGNPESIADDLASFAQVLFTRLFFVALSVSVSVNVCWHFFRIWLPRILKKDFGFSDSQMLWMTAAFYVAADLGCMLAGYATRRLTRHGLPVERSRKLVSFATSSLCLWAVVVVYLPNSWLVIPLVLIVAAGAMGGFANMFALAQETAPRHTAKVVGLVSAAPWFLLAWLNQFIGKSADEQGSFATSVLCISFVPLVGSCIGWLWPEGKRANREVA